MFLLIKKREMEQMSKSVRNVTKTENFRIEAQSLFSFPPRLILIFFYNFLSRVEKCNMAYVCSVYLKSADYIFLQS